MNAGVEGGEDDDAITGDVVAVAVATSDAATDAATATATDTDTDTDTAGDGDSDGSGAVVVEAPRCLNCGVPLAGKYCAACGQRDDPHVHRLGHFLSEAFEGLTHADSRLWRTLWPLLARPGLLTREFFAGRRQRYLPPFRLYIVVSLLFFVVVTLLPDTEVIQFGDMAQQRTLDAERAAGLADIAAQLAAEKDPQRRAALIIGQKALEAKQARDTADGTVSEPADAAPSSVDGTAATATSRSARICGDLNYVGPLGSWVAPRLKLGCIKSVEDEGSLGRAFLHNIPRAMFVFLPLIAAFMLLIYWRPRRYYVEHLLFYIHNHAMIFLLGTLLIPVFWLLRDTRGAPVLGWIVFLWLIWYLFRAMRVYYGQSRRRTLLKYLFMGTVYLSVSMTMLVLTALVSVVTL